MTTKGNIFSLNRTQAQKQIPKRGVCITPRILKLFIFIYHTLKSFTSPLLWVIVIVLLVALFSRRATREKDFLAKVLHIIGL